MYEIMNRIVDNAMDSCLNNLDETIISWEKIHIDQLKEYNKKNNNNLYFRFTFIYKKPADIYLTSAGLILFLKWIIMNMVKREHIRIISCNIRRSSTNTHNSRLSCN